MTALTTPGMPRSAATNRALPGIMHSITATSITVLVLAAIALSASRAGAAQADAQTAAAAAKQAAPAARKKSPYQPESMTRSARSYVAVTKGVDDLKVRRTNQGNLIRFSYRVVNADQAKTLQDRSATPMLIGHDSHAVLQVPVMDKVGPLRQSTAPEVGKEYWMMFSNKGDVVKAGERVSVVIGGFRVDGLRVE